ncbi:FitA-like ribbon-helix-helix domain-containing protein [Rhizobium sp. SL86]|uniref:FitA-like ribbon-helix-helix domain-containing protein n=1 Tax=Rhizobium sp. SL86 TaxID=2995148 RepID=UPI002275D0A6|nr:plasmid stabilization protein [Rhizobium sp. SL86]MCY1664880.1 plasmid stabilization protein [Rhizobium sp. SL86]
MGDLLIRNIPDAIRQSLDERAERSGRSVSNEVTEILVRELQRSDTASTETAGHRLRSILTNDVTWSEEELAAMDALRHAKDRPSPLISTE